MYIKLQCNECKSTFSISLERDINLEKCPCCGVRISSADDSRLLAITVPFVDNVPRLQGVSIFEVSPDTQATGEKRQRANDVFANAMDSLENVYNESSPEVQNLLASMLDTMFLLVNADARKGAIEQLSATHHCIRGVWADKVGAKHDEDGKLLFGEIL